MLEELKGRMGGQKEQRNGLRSESSDSLKSNERSPSSENPEVIQLKINDLERNILQVIIYLLPFYLQKFVRFCCDY